MNRKPTDRISDAIAEFRKRGPGDFARVVAEYGLLRSPISNVASRNLYWKLAPRYYRWRWPFPEAYAASLDPFKIIWTSPDEINRFSKRQYPQDANASRLFGTVKSGEWDRRSDIPTRPGYDGTPAYLYHANSFEETILHRSIKQRFVDEVPWTETPIVSEARSLLETERGRWRGCDSEAAIRRRCGEIEKLYHRISEKGYHTQFELIRQGEVRRVGFLDALANEILIDIGRDGELLFANGRHRLSIAKILEIDVIPVAVLIRHEKWMEKRDQAYRGEVMINHPDIRTLLDQ